jgi:hypothetical protein
LIGSGVEEETIRKWKKEKKELKEGRLRGGRKKKRTKKKVPVSPATNFQKRKRKVREKKKSRSLPDIKMAEVDWWLVPRKRKPI